MLRTIHYGGRPINSILSFPFSFVVFLHIISYRRITWQRRRFRRVPTLRLLMLGYVEVHLVQHMASRLTFHVSCVCWNMDKCCLVHCQYHPNTRVVSNTKNKSPITQCFRLLPTKWSFSSCIVYSWHGGRRDQAPSSIRHTAVASIAQYIITPARIRTTHS